MWLLLERKNCIFKYFFFTEKVKHNFNIFQVVQQNKSLFHNRVQET